jgi:hypothetical protein
MRYVVQAALVVAGIIHLLPLSGVLGIRRLEALYGIAVDDPNLEILLRHRAVLFGLLGLFLLIAAFRPAFRTAALAAGLASIGSFLLLAPQVGGYNAHIARVFRVDLVALVLLVVAAGVHSRARALRGETTFRTR